MKMVIVLPWKSLAARTGEPAAARPDRASRIAANFRNTRMIGMVLLHGARWSRARLDQQTIGNLRKIMGRREAGEGRFIKSRIGRPRPLAPRQISVPGPVWLGNIAHPH